MPRANPLTAIKSVRPPIALSQNCVWLRRCSSTILCAWVSDRSPQSKPFGAQISSRESSRSNLLRSISRICSSKRIASSSRLSGNMIMQQEPPSPPPPPNATAFDGLGSIKNRMQETTPRNSKQSPEVRLGTISPSLSRNPRRRPTRPHIPPRSGRSAAPRVPPPSPRQSLGRTPKSLSRPSASTSLT